MFLASQSVKVFPLAKYRSVESLDITSRLFYEQNVSNLIRQLIDTQGFIISGTVFTNGIVNSDAPFCFNLYGYYWEIAANTNLVDSGVSNGTYVIAQIQMQERTPDINTGVIPPQEIEGQDVEGEFQALQINTVTQLPTNGIYLVLLQKQGNNWIIPDSSYNKFDSKSLSITGIDGKH